MKKLLLTFVLGMATAYAFAGLQASGWSSHSLEYWPLSEVTITYDAKLVPVAAPEALVTRGAEVVAKLPLTLEDYQNGSNAVIRLEEGLVLPAGHAYKITVPKGSFAKSEDPAVTNDEYVIDFEIPATFSLQSTSPEQGSVVAGKLSMLQFFFPTEVAAFDGAEMTLYCEGKPMRTLPCATGWDWDLGQAQMLLGAECAFQEGLNYSVKLPRGAVHALYRDDIVNEECELNFTGGWTEPAKPLNFYKSYIEDNHGSTLGVVKFYYNDEVALSPEPAVQVWEGPCTELLKEVVPTLAREDKDWVLTADFGLLETPYREDGYTIVVPEGTLVAADGSVVFNQRGDVPFQETTSVLSLDASKTSLRANGRTVSVTGNAGRVTAYTLDGRKIAEATGDGASLTLPAAGAYVVRAGGRAWKLMVK